MLAIGWLPRHSKIKPVEAFLVFLAAPLGHSLICPRNYLIGVRLACMRAKP